MEVVQGYKKLFQIAYKLSSNMPDWFALVYGNADRSILRLSPPVD